MASYEQNKSSKLWSVRFREKVNGKVKNQRLSGFKTKREAQQAYAEYAANQQLKALSESPKEQEKQSILFDTLLSDYMRFQKTRVKEATYYSIDHAISSRMLPYFKGKTIDSITPKTVLDWMDTLSDYSYRYKKKLLTYLSSIYSYGEKYYGIENITKKVDRPRNMEAQPEMQFWTPDEFSAFISQVKSPDYKMLFEFLYITGCRRGEALALSWNDIDIGKQTVRINKSVTFKAKDGEKSFKVTTPKNAGSNRSVSIPKFLCNDLNEYRRWQSQNCTGDTFVFCGERPLPATSIAREMENAIRDAGVKRIRIHDLRHSCASLLIHKGVSIVAVSKRLGHTSIEQTLNTYSHMLPDDQKMILEVLENLGTGLGTKI